MSIGDRALDFLKVAGPLAFLLLLPVMMTLGLRRQALRAPEQAKASVCFSYFRLIRLSMVGGIFVWWLAIDLSDADTFVADLLHGTLAHAKWLSMMLPVILLWLAPALVYFLCLLLSSPIHALRGATRTPGQMWRQSFWAVARLVIPLTLLALAIASASVSGRAAVLLIAGAFVAWRIAQLRFADSYGMQLHGLTTGELRDRTFALAINGGAKLQHLYVLPTEQMRLANAFAHVRNNIFLTDYLLKNLSKREVDAVVAHEVTHLTKRHIGWRTATFVLAMFVVAGVAGFSEDLIPKTFPIGPVVYALTMCVVFFVSRRNEYAADAGAVKLTHDPEAIVTALAKLSRLNTMPIHWGKADERLLTHPSTLRRIERIAKTNAMPGSHLSELLRQSAAPPLEVYAIPATALPKGKVFSTRFKTTQAMRVAWIILLATAAIPAAFGYFAQSAQLAGSRLWMVYGAGFATMIGAALALTNFLPASRLEALEELLRTKLETRGALSPCAGGSFVSLSPDGGPRIYEGNWAWDIGFLSASPNRLSYSGEEARFSFQRKEITRIELGPGPVGWWRLPAVYLFWTESGGRERAINFRLLKGARSMRQMAAATRLLYRDLENWHRGTPASADSGLAITSAYANADDLGAPGFGNVTSISPRALGSVQVALREVFLNTFIAAGIATVLGLEFPPIAASGGSGGLYLLLCVWLGRGFVLWPYWGFRDGRIGTRPPQASPTPASQA